MASMFFLSPYRENKVPMGFSNTIVFNGFRANIAGTTEISLELAK